MLGAQEPFYRQLFIPPPQFLLLYVGQRMVPITQVGKFFYSQF
jgi:hypothetical protein